MARRIPGRRREICEALAASETHAAADALLSLPTETPGRIEAVYRALRAGACRPQFDGRHAPRMLAFEFRRSRAREFGEVLRQVVEAFGPQLEHLELDGKLVYRFHLDPLLAARGGNQTQTRLRWLQGRLIRWAGTRMWINGWVFDRKGPLPTTSHAALMHAWLDWAAGSRRERRRSDIA